MKVINDFHLFLENENSGSIGFDSIVDDINTIMDVLGLPLSVDSIKKISPSEYEVTMDEVSVRFNKLPGGHIPNSYKFYSNSDNYVPRIIMNNNGESFDLKFNHPDFKEISDQSDLIEIKKNHELYFLLKKCLDLDSDEDRDNFMNYFEGRCNSRKNDTSSRDELKRLKNIALSFSDESNIGKFYGNF